MKLLTNRQRKKAYCDKKINKYKGKKESKKTKRKWETLSTTIFTIYTY